MRMPYESSYPPPPNSVYPASPAMTSSPQPGRTGSTSPFPNGNYHYGIHSPYPAPMEPSRQGSFSGFSNPGEHFSDSESKEKQRCPHPDCGKHFKDIKAHMLTHMTERPEKCPIQTCDYHVKGFARKYDKNRHTLTHYKGTMVCGFCPGSGSAAEKSFNRADVFKRHLTAVHGVEQTPPNSRKKSAGHVKKLSAYPPDATGKCSTCSQTFSNAQDFYEHLDDCVLRIVQQEDPAEAVNAKRLAEVENDPSVHATLEKNMLPTTGTQTSSTADDEEDEDMDEDELADEDSKGRVKTSASPTKKKGNPANGVQKSRGMTHSRGGRAAGQQAPRPQEPAGLPVLLGLRQGPGDHAEACHGRLRRPAPPGQGRPHALHRARGARPAVRRQGLRHRPGRPDHEAGPRLPQRHRRGKGPVDLGRPDRRAAAANESAIDATTTMHRKANDAYVMITGGT